jgi:hypothetical protein
MLSQWLLDIAFFSCVILVPYWCCSFLAKKNIGVAHGAPFIVFAAPVWLTCLSTLHLNLSKMATPWEFVLCIVFCTAQRLHKCMAGKGGK